MSLSAEPDSRSWTHLSVPPQEQPSETDEEPDWAPFELPIPEPEPFEPDEDVPVVEGNPVLDLVRVLLDVENVRSQEQRNDAEAALKAMLRVG